MHVDHAPGFVSVLAPLNSLSSARFETPEFLKKVAAAGRRLAELKAIRVALLDVKHRIRAGHRRIYSQDLVDDLFMRPYTKIEFIERDLDVSRLTAAK